MEKEIKVKTKDKKVIYGTLGISDNRSSKLIIFVHGFLGNRHEHIFFNASTYFVNKGFDTFRFDLYSGAKGGRHFRDTTIRIHGNDLNAVIEYFRGTYKKIYVVGHSYGGTTLLFANSTLINAMVFWDASYIKRRRKEFPYNKKFKSFVMDWGFEVIVGKQFVDELKDFPNCGDLVAKIQAPVKFITAGKMGNKIAGKKYFAKANQPKELVNIQSADHNFNGVKEERILIKETFDWVSRY